VATIKVSIIGVMKHGMCRADVVMAPYSRPRLLFCHLIGNHPALRRNITHAANRASLIKQTTRGDARGGGDLKREARLLRCNAVMKGECGLFCV
jgi:hypothetical protein